MTDLTTPRPEHRVEAFIDRHFGGLIAAMVAVLSTVGATLALVAAVGVVAFMAVGVTGAVFGLLLWVLVNVGPEL